MPRVRSAIAILICLLPWTTGWVVAQAPPPASVSAINQRLSSGQLTRIVCFGDSITGAYYHTGGQRAWCDLLGLALQRRYPRANLQMINAGISGHTTVNALARLEQDVLAHQPHVVIIMFGMNDVTRVPLETYTANLRAIIQRCRHAGAAVVLCTPNGVSPNQDRPEERLAEYATQVKELASELELPLADCLRAWQKLRSNAPVEWSLMMSDAIHPNLNGHRHFAELIAESMCGQACPVHDVPTACDALHHTFDKLHRNEAVRVIAMPPYDALITKALKQHFPGAELEVTSWPTEHLNVTQLADWAQRIRGLGPDLVIPAPPLASLNAPQDTFIAQYEWILNWSFPFAGRAWDILPILPPETSDSTALQRQNLLNARAITLGKDVRFVESSTDNARDNLSLLSAWLVDAYRAWQGARNLLPEANAQVLIPVQSWPHRPGPRCVSASLYFPSGQLENVTPQTGIMLTLHNWGGLDCAGTADPQTLAEELNVVAVCVNYLQSGRSEATEAVEPYDFGYFQALDALRALAYVRSGLQKAQIDFADRRLFCAGGSGGGNVTLMANKLAPRTFTCIVDMCGMKKLSDDIAFDLPGGSSLNARWNRDPQSANYLSLDGQELRYVGHPLHLATMKQMETSSKIIVVHGVDDATCPYADARQLVENLLAADLDVEAHFIDQQKLDGQVFTSSGHALGNRTQIVLQVAGKYLRADSPEALQRAAPTDFDRQEDVRYQTSYGEFVISYASGLPVATFVPTQSD